MTALTATRTSAMMFVLSAVAAAGAGCSSEPPPQQRVDSPVAQAAQEDSAASSPPATNIGKLDLLGRLAPDGKCTSQSLGDLSAVKRNVTYEGDYPIRRITVGVGDATRTFRPINMDVVVRQEAGVGQQNVESINIIFLPTGDIRYGAHTYAGAAGEEKAALFPDDTARVKDLAQAVLQQCNDHD